MPLPATTPVTAYPASDPGFAAPPVDELLAGEADLIARISSATAPTGTVSSDILALRAATLPAVYPRQRSPINHLARLAACCGSA